MSRVVLNWPFEVSWPPETDVVVPIFVGICAFLLGSKKVGLPGCKGRLEGMSVGHTLVFFSMFVWPVDATVLVAAMAAAGENLLDNKTPRLQRFYRVVLRAGPMVIAAWLSGTVFLMIKDNGSGEGSLGVTALAAAPAASTYWILNTLTAACFTAFIAGRRLFKVWPGTLLRSGPGYLAAGTIALMASRLHEVMSLTVLTLLAPIAGVVFYSFKLYMDLLRERREHRE